MRKFFTALFAAGALCSYAQVITSPGQNAPVIMESAPPGCLSDQLRQQLFNNDPAMRARHDAMEQQILQWQQANNYRVASGYTISVVVHIIHNNGPENISNALVIQGIQDMNEAFSNSGPYSDPNGVNTGIQFCLAQQDEFGNPSTGINRVVSPLTNLTAETDDAALKNLIRWDPTKYLNIWLVNEITSQAMGSGVAGYAYLPSSHGNPEDGIVNEARWFGSDPHNSKIHIHETGHYLGLYHTFEGGCTNNNCLTDGDRVCDTPPDNSTAAAGCQSAPNSCATDDDDLSANNPFRPVASGGLGDQPDMIEDYMDYGLQYCQSRFTQGQADRMVAALTNERASLLNSIGCQSLCTNPITIGFTMSASVITVGGSINFTNTSVGGTNYVWEVNNTQFATTANSSYTFNSLGYYIITLTVSNGDPSCSETTSDTVLVQCGAQASFTASPPGPYSPGVTINFTNTSTGSLIYEWVLDGVPQGISTNYSQTFNTAGGHYVYLVASNGQCFDTASSYFFQVGSCDLAKMTNHWFFVNNSLDFSTGSPVASTSPISNSSQECTSTISDVNGNLLFYSDGMTVWDKNNQVMPNGTGLMGHYSTTQGVLITPDPGNANRYYVFTTDALEHGYANGLRYSIVDMTLNSGNGAVTATKNVLVVTGVGEKLTGTWHSNGQDIWIGTRSAASNSYYAFLLTPSGLNMTPVISNIGVNSDYGLGSMRFSHDGNHMAAVIITSNIPRYLVLADFNKTTGVYSNPINVVFSSATWEQPYDVEFSPDNSKVYCSLVNYGQLYQVDLAAGGPSQIIASLTTVDTYPGGSFGHLLMGLDGYLYVGGVTQNTKLDVVYNPNLAGSACNYTQNAVSLFTTGNWVLPNMMQGLLVQRAVTLSGAAMMCEGGSNYYNLNNSLAGDSVVWSLHGQGQLSSSTSLGTFLQSTITGTNDSIIAVHYGSCGVTRDTFVVHTYPSPVPFLGNDTALCGGQRTLTPGSGFTSYLWQNNSTASTFTTTFPGTYWVQVTNSAGCTASDTIVLTAVPVVPPVNLGSDVTVCLGHTATLNAGNSYSTYTWQDGSVNSTFTAYLPGTYSVTVTGTCYTGSDVINVFVDESNVPLNLGPDRVLCANDFPLVISATPGYSYLWQDGSTAATFSAAAYGQYWVTVTDSAGCSARDTIEIFNCLSTGPDASAEAFTVYPNPADESLTILHSGNEVLNVTLFDAAGKLVFKTILDPQAGLPVISTSAFAEGFYLLEIREGSKVYHSKVVIGH